MIGNLQEDKRTTTPVQEKDGLASKTMEKILDNKEPSHESIIW